MAMYAGIDLHSNNSVLGVIDAGGEQVFSKRMPNEPAVILGALQPFQRKIAGVVVESTFNWYWLVDLLMDKGYRIHLANPAAIQKYSGLKHSNDASDALWLAEMLRLGVLPEGYIYPKEQRPVRDLLRKRGHLVRLRTSLILSLQNAISRNFGMRMGVNKIRLLKTDVVTPLFETDAALLEIGKANKETIDFLTRRIRSVEKAVKATAGQKIKFDRLRTLPGVGPILSLTIGLETWDFARFRKAGNYASYCRKVPSQWTSNGKRKGRGNVKNGNKYLAWAFSEASELARRFDPMARAYFDRKASRTNRMVAHSALAHKLARAAYCIMRDGTDFEPKRMFA